MAKTKYRDIKETLEVLDINPVEFWEIANRVQGWFPDIEERRSPVTESKVRIILEEFENGN